MRIAFLGDSLTAGSPGASYLRTLRHMLPRHRLLDHGRAGDSVADLYGRLLETGFDACDLAVVWIGTNDAATGAWAFWDLETQEQATWEETLDRLRTVYGRLLAFALERAPQALCVPPVVADELDEAWARRVAEVGEVVARAVVAEPRAALLDLAPAFAAARAASHEPQSFTIDGVHLSGNGAQVVAHALRRRIDELFTDTTDGG